MRRLYLVTRDLHLYIGLFLSPFVLVFAVSVVYLGHGLAPRAWRILADATAYLLLVITVSGIYLWVALRAERRVGVILLLAGAITFWGLVYAVAA